MSAFNENLDIYHRQIIFSLLFMIVFFMASCTFHDIIPICHYLFGCDHGMHATATLLK